MHAHPSQALLDLLTVRNKKGTLSGLRVAIIGDIAHSRVARSNIIGFTKMGSQVVLAGPPNDQRAKVVKRDDWNEYVIRCQGRRIQLWINGTQTVDYTEPDETIEQNGLIGLQIHGGPPSEAHYKDIRIKVLE